MTSEQVILVNKLAIAFALSDVDLVEAFSAILGIPVSELDHYADNQILTDQEYDLFEKIFDEYYGDWSEDEDADEED